MRKEIARDLPNGTHIVAEIEIRDYFSYCGSVWYAGGKGWSGARRARTTPHDPDACGQIVDELRTAFPEHASIRRMHLSNAETGEPMHAEANGWYWYERGELERVQDLLRVESVPPDLDRAAFNAFVRLQRNRWASEAASVRALIASL